MKRFLSIALLILGSLTANAQLMIPTFGNETQDIQSDIKENQSDLKAKRSEKRKLEAAIQKSKDDVTKSISDSYANVLFDHIESLRHCHEEVRVFTSAEWSQYCDSNKIGSVNLSICDDPRFRNDSEKRVDTQSCKRALSDFKKNIAETQKLQTEIDQLEANLQKNKENLKEAKRSRTEGDICIECMQKGNSYSFQGQEQRSNPMGSSLSNLAMSLSSLYMNYQSARSGWPTAMPSNYGYGIGMLGNSYSMMPYQYQMMQLQMQQLQYANSYSGYNYQNPTSLITPLPSSSTTTWGNYSR